MLRSLVISPDRDLSANLIRALDASGATKVLRKLDKYPSSEELIRALRAHAVDLVFLSFEDLEKALQLVHALEKEDANQLQIVAIHRVMDPRVLRESMRAGVREFLADPFDKTALWDSLTHLKDLLQKRPTKYETTNRLYTFFPSKAGSGTSTVALNVSAALARRKDSRVLLSDFDLNSGMMRFLLKLDNPHSVPEACEHSEEMDENLWPQLVTKVSGLDVLHAGRINPHVRIEPAQVRNLVAFMRRNYETLCFDLSGNLERYSIELMQESKSVFLVCTPEIPSLHQAREKLTFLREFELDTRVSVILNRVGRKPLFNEKQVAELVGAPVITKFPNDYVGVYRALTDGTLIDPVSELGKSYADFAESLYNEKPAAGGLKHEVKRKFLEFLAVAPESERATTES